jgi:hypothetical protein
VDGGECDGRRVSAWLAAAGEDLGGGSGPDRSLVAWLVAPDGWSPTRSGQGEEAEGRGAMGRSSPMLLLQVGIGGRGRRRKTERLHSEG